MDKKQIVNSTIQYVEDKIRQEAEKLLLDEIAERIGYSKFYLNRLFQEQIGVTIHQYIKERRLTTAAEKLAQTQRPIAEIAFEAGYQSQQAFTNAFSNLYLCSPSEYRMQGVWIPLRQPHMAIGSMCMRAAA